MSNVMPLWLGCAKWRHRSGSTLAKVMNGITWTNVNVSLLRFCGIHMKVEWNKFHFKSFVHQTALAHCAAYTAQNMYKGWHANEKDTNIWQWHCLLSSLFIHRLLWSPGPPMQVRKNSRPQRPHCSRPPCLLRGSRCHCWDSVGCLRYDTSVGTHPRLIWHHATARSGNLGRQNMFGNHMLFTGSISFKICARFCAHYIIRSCWIQTSEPV